MKTELLLKKYNKYLFPNYAPLPVVPDRANQTNIYDINGDQYIDFTGGIAVNALGHHHKILVETLKEQGEKLWHTSNFYANEPAINLAEYLVENSFADKVFFANSGTEANEAAIKLARKYATSQISEEKTEIISFQNSFHGRSMMMIAIGGQEKYKQGFGPLPSGIHFAEFNNIDSVKQCMNENTAAVIIEPIQGESGVHPANVEFLRALRNLCDDSNVLLIFDEIQCGIGRTGSLFAYQHYNVVPDILTIAKALGAGMPISAMLAKDHVAKAFTVGTHGSTFGGNPLATAVAYENLKIINDPVLLNHVTETSHQLKTKIHQLNEKHQIFQDIRGIGLLIGLELKTEYQNQAGRLMQLAVEEKLLVLQAGINTVRLAPSLIIDDKAIQEGLYLFEKTIEKFKTTAPKK